MPEQLTVFHINFAVKLGTEQGRRIATAARVELRPKAFDNEWKDTVGRAGWVTS
jgi:hypothetical protein